MDKYYTDGTYNHFFTVTFTIEIMAYCLKFTHGLKIKVLEILILLKICKMFLDEKFRTINLQKKNNVY